MQWEERRDTVHLKDTYWKTAKAEEDRQFLTRQNEPRRDRVGQNRYSYWGTSTGIGQKFMLVEGKSIGEVHIFYLP